MANKESYLRMLPTGIRQPLRKLFGSGATLTNDITGDVVGTVTGNVTGNITGNWTGDHLLTLQSAEHGAGAIGTAFAPRTYRGYGLNGDIITEIHVDLTGLGCKGVAAADAIGLATGAAYIGRYVVATCGVVYKVEMACLETPAGTDTEDDIMLSADDEDDIAYDGEVDGGNVIDPATGLAAGTIYENTAPALTANDYLYLTEGDTGGDEGTYTAGQLLIRLYGHPALS